DLPDFRAAERTFQLLEQVAGRAGRGDQPGRVIIQTYSPDNTAIAAVATHDYGAFAREELANRRDADYPPYARIIVLRIDAADEDQARAGAAAAGEAARAAAGASVRVNGLAPAPLERLRGRSRWQVWLYGHDRQTLAATARAGARAVRAGGDLRVSIDVDPQSVL